MSLNDGYTSKQQARVELERLVAAYQESGGHYHARAREKRHGGVYTSFKQVRGIFSSAGGR